MINPEKILPPQIALVFLSFCIMLDVLLNPARIVSFPTSWIGAILLAAGLPLMISAHRCFKKQNTPVKHSQQPQSFVNSGPYKFSRNPMYIGGLTMFLGLAIMLGTWPYFLFPLLMFVVLQFIYIPWEEKRMAQIFGKDFNNYLKSTRRWI